MKISRFAARGVLGLRDLDLDFAGGAPGGPIDTPTVGVGGARNAGLLAVRVLAASEPALLDRMRTFQVGLADTARGKDAALQAQLG